MRPWLVLAKGAPERTPLNFNFTKTWAAKYENKKWECWKTTAPSSIQVAPAPNYGGAALVLGKVWCLCRSARPLCKRPLCKWPQTNVAQIPCKFQAEKNCTVPSPTSSGRPGPPVTPRASAGSQRRGYPVARRGAADQGSRHRWHLSPTSQPRVACIRGALRFFAAAEVDV